MQHTEASAGLLSLAAHTSDAEGWLVPVVSAPACRAARLPGHCRCCAPGRCVPAAARPGGQRRALSLWRPPRGHTPNRMPTDLTASALSPSLQVQAQPASRQERLSEQASLFMANLLAQAAPGTSDWLCGGEPSDPSAPFQQQTAAPPAACSRQQRAAPLAAHTQQQHGQQHGRQQRHPTSQDSEVQPLPRISLAGQQSTRALRRPSAAAPPQARPASAMPRPASAMPRPASAMPRPAPKPATPSASRPAVPAQAASPKSLWRPSGTAQASPVTPCHSTPGTPTRHSLAGTPPAVRTTPARASAAVTPQAQQRPASAAAKQAPHAQELSPSTKVVQWLFSPAHPAAPAGRTASSGRIRCLHDAIQTSCLAIHQPGSSRSTAARPALPC